MIIKYMDLFFVYMAVAQFMEVLWTKMNPSGFPPTPRDLKPSDSYLPVLALDSCALVRRSRPKAGSVKVGQTAGKLPHVNKKGPESLASSAETI